MFMDSFEYSTSKFPMRECCASILKFLSQGFLSKGFFLFYGIYYFAYGIEINSDSIVLFAFLPFRSNDS